MGNQDWLGSLLFRSKGKIMSKLSLEDMQAEATDIDNTLSECHTHLACAVSCETEEDCVINLKELRDLFKEAVKMIPDIID